MRSIDGQRGITALGLIFVLVFFGALFLIGLKLLPIYLESMKIEHALEKTVEDPNVGDLSKQEIAYSVVRRLDIDGVYLITERNWRDYLDIQKQRDRVSIVAKWHKEAPLVANLGLYADFEKTVANRP